jgi:peptidoglycan/xylan/chitin deacetylase (PgdA/CDA1 family)
LKGIFTISLDFELHWGGFEKWHLGISNEEFRMKNEEPSTQPPVSYIQYFLNTRKVIPEILKAFAQHEVHVTWATVGMLFHENKKQLRQHEPALKPSYLNQVLSAYHYIETTGIGEDEQDDPFHYALSLIKQIQQTPGQEIGTHTFAHYYCNEPGQNTEQFRADLRAAHKAAKAQGISLHSLVFPRNQFNEACLKVCIEEGIRVVRSNPKDWYWQIQTPAEESIWKRINRGLDAYLPAGQRKSFALASLPLTDGFPLCLPASRFLRPYTSRFQMLNRLRLQRIKAEMTYAAKQGEVYHLWWHPHNFGWHPEASMRELQHILQHYHDLNKQYGMQSLSMKEIADLTSRTTTPVTSIPYVTSKE